ncbi:MAG: nitrite reductase small subunit NirD [Saprospiraceae bacterium]
MQNVLDNYESVMEEQVTYWYPCGYVDDFPENAGACVKYKHAQIAVFYFARMGKWYACQNLCPHKVEMVLSRGMIGDTTGIAKVACPMHKHNFSLEDGTCLTAELPAIATYPVRVENLQVFVGFNF